MPTLTLDTLILGVGWYAVFVFSTCLHEAGHAWAALKLGDPTAYHGGQVSLNPAPHIQREPVGMVVIPILSFILGGWMLGWASAPYDPHWAERHPRRAALMALAGPAANLILLLAAGVAIRLGLHFGYFTPPAAVEFDHLAVGQGPASALALILSLFFMLNLLLMCFNLLPLPPLDGSGALPLVMKEETALRYMAFIRQSGFWLFGIIIAWHIFKKIFWPIALVAINVLYLGIARYGG